VEHFTFSNFSFCIRATSRLLLPAYKGSVFRGGFGHAFRRACCTAGMKDCSSCLLRDSCVYLWIFETPVPEDTALMKKYPSAPHPFILEPPLGSHQAYEPGERLEFGLVLVGQALDYLPYFIYSFNHLGQMGIGRGKGKFVLESVSWKPFKNDSSKRVLFHRDNGEFTKPPAPVTWQEIVEQEAPTKVTLSFLTPTRIKYRGRFTDQLEFHVLFRNLLRRASLLSYFHCGFKLDDSHFPDLIEQAKEINISDSRLHWHDWTRWSNRQQTKMKMGGVMGEITYEGDLSPFWPYIRLGQYVHVGKGSSFGLGKYEVVTDGNERTL